MNTPLFHPVKFHIERYYICSEKTYPRITPYNI